MTVTRVRGPESAASAPGSRRTASRGGPARPPRAPRPSRSWRDHLTGWGFVLPASLVVVGLSIFPAGWAFVISRQKTDLITPAEGVGWDNYRRILDDPNALDAARHTLYFTMLFVPTSVLAGILLAVALNRPLRLQWFYRTCIFVPFVASAAATGILANFVFDPHFGIANNLLRVLGLPRQGFLEAPGQALGVLVLIALWGSIGFNVVIYLAALQSIPHDVVEAAIVDGAGPISVFRYVTMPELAPVTVFVTIWQTITALQLFDLVYTTTKGQPGDATVTIVYYLYRQAFELFHAGYGSALAYCVFAVTLAFTALLVWYSRRTGTEAF